MSSDRSLTGVLPILQALDLDLAYDGPPVVRGLSVAIPAGSITAIVGANACAKSNLWRALARILSPADGRVLLDGEEIHRLPTRLVATRLGLLNQWSEADEYAVTKALELRSMAPLDRQSRSRDSPEPT